MFCEGIETSDYQMNALHSIVQTLAHPTFPDLVACLSSGSRDADAIIVLIGGLPTPVFVICDGLAHAKAKVKFMQWLPGLSFAALFIAYGDKMGVWDVGRVEVTPLAVQSHSKAFWTCGLTSNVVPLAVSPTTSLIAFACGRSVKFALPFLDSYNVYSTAIWKHCIDLPFNPTFAVWSCDGRYIAIGTDNAGAKSKGPSIVFHHVPFESFPLKESLKSSGFSLLVCFLSSHLISSLAIVTSVSQTQAPDVVAAASSSSVHG